MGLFSKKSDNKSKCAKCKRELTPRDMFTSYTCSKCGKTFCAQCAGWSGGSVMQLSCPYCK
jgi:predicted RNA-binding Zn-ribbon protein involved in translation (DUF1610 family)